MTIAKLECVARGKKSECVVCSQIFYLEDLEGELGTGTMLDPKPYELGSMPKVFSLFWGFCGAVLEIRVWLELDCEREERTSEFDAVGGGGDGETEPERLAARRRRRSLGSEIFGTVNVVGDGVKPVQP